VGLEGPTLSASRTAQVTQSVHFHHSGPWCSVCPERLKDFTAWELGPAIGWGGEGVSSEEGHVPRSTLRG
jgi:hypothetical protein